jgi:hypothetical protein
LSIGGDFLWVGVKAFALKRRNNDSSDAYTALFLEQVCRQTSILQDENGWMAVNSPAKVCVAGWEFGTLFPCTKIRSAGASTSLE